MGMVQEIQYYLTVFLSAFVIVALILFGLLIYLLKFKKIRAKEEKIDYNNFERVDSTEYVKFKDVISSDSSGMLKGMGAISMGNHEYVTGINILGIDYFDLPVSQQQRVIANSIAFVDQIKKPIQVRQATKSVDISVAINSDSAKRKELEKELYKLELEIDNVLQLMEDNADPDNQELFDSLEAHYTALNKKYNSLQYLHDEATVLVNHMKAISSDKIKPQPSHNIFFSYRYNPDEFTEDKTEDEIIATAIMELNSQAQAYISALENCGCHCRPCTAKEIINLINEHFRKLSSDKESVEEMLGSSYTSLFVTSESILDLEREKLGQEAFAKKIDEYMKNLNAQLKRDDLVRERTVQRILDDAAKKVRKEWN